MEINPINRPRGNFSIEFNPTNFYIDQIGPSHQDRVRFDSTCTMRDFRRGGVKL
jgi:hypothetical protein